MMTIVCLVTPKVVALRSTQTITMDLSLWLPILQEGWAGAWITWLDWGRMQQEWCSNMPFCCWIGPVGGREYM